MNRILILVSNEKNGIMVLIQSSGSGIVNVRCLHRHNLTGALANGL